MITLAFHDVVEDDPSVSGIQGCGASRYKITPQQLSAHLDAISPFAKRKDSTVLEILEGTRTPEMLLTFDDGGKSAFTHIDGIVRGKGWRAHFFVTAKFIDQPAFVTREEIKELENRGHVIGSHSYSHPLRMGTLSNARLHEEWSKSVQMLSDIIGKPIIVASVPGGAYSPRVVEAAAACGIKALFTSRPTKKVERIGDCFVLGRFCLDRNAPIRKAEALASGKKWPIFEEALLWNARSLAKTLTGQWYFQIRNLILSRGNRTARSRD